MLMSFLLEKEALACLPQVNTALDSLQTNDPSQKFQKFIFQNPENARQSEDE